MKVRFEKGILDDSQSWDSLDEIVYHFLARRHLWVIDDPRIIEESNWIQSDIRGRAGKRNIDVLQKCYTDSIYPSGRSRMHEITINITLQGNTEHELSPEDAKRCLNTPASVAVENAESDGAFLEAMIHALGRKELLDAHTEGWWKIEHLGGYGEVEKRVEQIRGETIGPLRVFVLADSDRLFPEQVTDTIRKIKKYCDAHQDVSYAILRKRKIENYLPVSVLQRLSRKFKKTLQAYLSLSEEQRAHYDMKCGFRKNTLGQAEAPREQKHLYKHVSKRILDDLCDGFGTEVWRYFKSARDMITEEDMRFTCRSDPDEIDRILDQIERLI